MAVCGALGMSRCAKAVAGGCVGRGETKSGLVTWRVEFGDAHVFVGAWGVQSSVRLGVGPGGGYTCNWTPVIPRDPQVFRFRIPRPRGQIAEMKKIDTLKRGRRKYFTLYSCL